MNIVEGIASKQLRMGQSNAVAEINVRYEMKVRASSLVRLNGPQRANGMMRYLQLTTMLQAGPAAAAQPAGVSGSLRRPNFRATRKGATNMPTNAPIGMKVMNTR